MKCKLCEEKLLALLYGELGEKDAAAMEEHLKASESCRRAYQSFRSVLEAVAGVEESDPPPAMHSRIMGHAEELVPRKRSFWALMLRPAVTTAVVGAISVGVYFTTIRHRAPSYLDERIFTEDSSARESKQRQPAAPHAAQQVESPRKEAADQAFLFPLSESHGGIEPEGTGPEQRERLGKTKRMAPTVPSERGQLSLEADSPGSASWKGLLPERIEGALGLASEGHCTEAEQEMNQYLREHPKDEGCGAGWLEVARCFSDKGDTEAARRAAQKALSIPAHAQEAQGFLESLQPAPMRKQPRLEEEPKGE